MVFPSLIMRFLLLAATAWPSPFCPTIYETVLRYVQQEYTEKPVVLFSSVIKNECGNKGCPVLDEEQWPVDWLTDARSRKLITQFCEYRNERCVDASGQAVWLPGAVYVMLSSVRPCGEGCVEVSGHFNESAGRSARLLWTVYRLEWQEEKWNVISADRVVYSYIN